MCGKETIGIFQKAGENLKGEIHILFYTTENLHIPVQHIGFRVLPPDSITAIAKEFLRNSISCISELEKYFEHIIF